VSSHSHVSVISHTTLSVTMTILLVPTTTSILLTGLGHPTITIPVLLTTGCFDSYCISRNPIFLIFTALYLDETPNSNFPKNPRLSSFWEWQLHFPNSPNFAQNSNSDFDSNFLRISKLSYNPPCLWSS
jgi:hypothetical protein